MLTLLCLLFLWRWLGKFCSLPTFHLWQNSEMSRKNLTYCHSGQIPISVLLNMHLWQNSLDLNNHSVCDLSRYFLILYSKDNVHIIKSYETFASADEATRTCRTIIRERRKFHWGTPIFYLLFFSLGSLPILGPERIRSQIEDALLSIKQASRVWGNHWA